VVAARFKGDDKGSALGPITGLRQGAHLSMGVTGPRMKPFSHQPTVLIENNSTHERVWAGLSIGKGSQRQCPPHPGIPHQLKGKSCNERHSPTT
jgi:hypothetical protein